MAEERGDGVSHLIVVGASAGGIEALATLIDGLPADLEAPLVIAQHIDPNRPSHLREIFARRTRLAVHAVETSERLRPATVYVVPADRHVRIDDQHVSTVLDDQRAPKPSVDLLLESAAAAFGERLVAVILTGSGSDGTLGAAAVKAAGGTVVIQNPATATFPSMPASLPASLVDVVADVDSIADILVDLIRGEAIQEQSEEDRTLTSLLDRLREQSGIDFTQYKRPTIVRRIQRRMAAARSPDLRDYLRVIRSDPDEYGRLVSSFLIKVTEFFRDRELFEELRVRIVPALIEEARPRRELRVWSAGCATGEEAYSLAMIVAAALGDDLPVWNVRIFGTDLDADAIAYARRGVYPRRALDNVPTEYVEPFLDVRDGDFSVGRTIRALTVFGHHDLAQRAPFPRTDLVLCRNVLIYFTPELQRRALHLFAFSLRIGGMLVLGKTETTSPLATAFVLDDSRLKTYRREGAKRVLPPLTYGGRSLPPPVVNPPRVVTRPLRDPSRPDGIAPSAARADSLFLQLPVGIVVVNREYDVLAINTRARELLGIHIDAIGRDLVHMTRHGGLADLADVLDRALTGQAASTEVRLTNVPGQVSDRRIWLQAYPHGAAEGGFPTSVALVVSELPARTLTPEGAGTDADAREPRTDPSELRGVFSANQVLRADNSELSASNTVLRGHNEELQFAAEEAQAATEEIETLNEELQATNEELETLNEELQATNEELETTNSDLDARAQELQELRVALEQQQAGVIAAMSDAVLVVGVRGEVMLTNRAFESLGDRLFEDEHASDVPISHLVLRAATGETFTQRLRGVTPDGGRRWFEVAGTAIASDDGTLRGGVLVLRDITDRSLAAMQQEFLAIVTHEVRTPLTALNGYLQLLARTSVRADEPGGDGTERRSARRHLELAQAEVRRIASLVADLTDAARIQTGRLAVTVAPTDLSVVVRDAVAVAVAGSAGEGPPIETAIDPDVTMAGDPARLQQVLMNLLTNAQTYAPDSDAIRVRLGTAGPEAILEVEDRGPGIPLERLEHLFTRPVPASAAEPSSGLGLGLYISNAIVTAHGGTIDATSTVELGTLVRVRLPLEQASEGDAASGQGDGADANASSTTR